MTIFTEVLELTKSSLEFAQNQLVEEINKVKTDITKVEKNIKRYWRRPFGSRSCFSKVGGVWRHIATE